MASSGVSGEIESLERKAYCFSIFSFECPMEDCHSFDSCVNWGAVVSLVLLLECMVREFWSVSASSHSRQLHLPFLRALSWGWVDRRRWRTGREERSQGDNCL